MTTNKDEFWTWYGTALIVAFVLIVTLVAVVGGNVDTAARLVAVGLGLAVLAASAYQLLNGLSHRHQD